MILENRPKFHCKTHKSQILAHLVIRVWSVWPDLRYTACFCFFKLFLLFQCALSNFLRIKEAKKENQHIFWWRQFLVLTSLQPHECSLLGSVHKLRWQVFGFFWLPMLTLSRHFWTIYPPLLVNVVCERPVLWKMVLCLACINIKAQLFDF